jgi:hypothetical protein
VLLLNQFDDRSQRFDIYMVRGAGVFTRYVTGDVGVVRTEMLPAVRKYVRTDSCLAIGRYHIPACLLFVSFLYQTITSGCSSKIALFIALYKITS